MKKFFSTFALLVFILEFTLLPVCAKKESMTARVNRVGRELLVKNQIDDKVRFRLRKTSKVNAYADIYKDIVVYSGLVKLCDDDDELAGIIGHEIGHIVNSHLYKQAAVYAAVYTAVNVAAQTVPAVALGTGLAYNVSSLTWSRSREFESDVTAVDLMIRAGYNPLAMVSVMHKISDNYFDFLSSHPSGEKRTKYIFDYISYTYPEYLKKGYKSDSYEDFLVQIQPVLDEREKNPKKMEKYLNKQAKLKEKREKKYEKYSRATRKQLEKQAKKEQEQAIKEKEKAKMQEQKALQKAQKEKEKAELKEQKEQLKQKEQEQKELEKLKKQQEKAKAKELKQKEKETKAKED